MHVRMLVYRIEQSFHLVETAERGKRRRAFLNKEFASRAGLDFLQTGEKIVARNLQRSQFRGYGAVDLQWHGGKKPAQRDHADFLAQRFQIGADKAVGMLGDLLNIDVRGEWHGARVNLQNLEPRLGVRNADFDFAIEAARTPQRGVKDFGNIGRADDDDLAARHETIHQAEELRHNALFDFADHFGALGSHGVDFVDKENRGGMARRFLEDLAELGLALPVKLPHDFGTIEVNEVNAAFGGYGARQQRLTRAWRAVQ